MNFANIDSILQNSTISIENPEDRSVRLRIEEAEANQKRQQKQVKFWVLIVIISTTFLACLYFVFISNDIESKNWAKNIISALVSGFLGFELGNKSKNINS